MTSFSLDDFQGNSKPVLPMAPHTQKKHVILKKYLQAWFYIMSSGNGRIIYIDGFAGSGEYDTGDVGSPIIALECLFKRNPGDEILSRKCEYVFIFIEKDEESRQALANKISEMFPNIPNNVIIHIIPGGFKEIIGKLLDKADLTGKHLAPTFAFIDPFGYSQIPMDIMVNIMKHPKCEIMVNFMTSFVKRFGHADKKREAICDELFGCQEWRGFKDYASPDEKTQFITNLYISQLKSVAKARYVCKFEMYNHHNQPHYDLVFATNGHQGMKAMKDAMYAVDCDCTYRFKDNTDPQQTRLIDFTDEKVWTGRAAEQIYAQFKGMTVPRDQVELFVYIHTDYVYRVGCLIALEKEGKILKVNVPSGKRKANTFPKGCTISFSS
jgi:three-Cys-motif partner protein